MKTSEAQMSRRDFLFGVLNHSSSLSNAARDVPVVFTLGITDMCITESCTLCYACVDRCPDKAVRIDSGRLFFDSRKCTGCGYCEQICPEDAITLLEMEGTPPIGETPLYSDDMVRCSKCNAEYASAKMIRKISATLRIEEVAPVCPSCKEMGMYDGLFSNKSAKIMYQRKMHEVESSKSR
jgi:ferredoxin